MISCIIGLIWVVGIPLVAGVFVMVYYRDERICAERGRKATWWYFRDESRYDPHGEMIPASVAFTLFWPLASLGFLIFRIGESICSRLKVLTNYLIDNPPKISKPNIKIKIK